MREISLLKSLSNYPQFVRILDVIKDEFSREKKIHCVFEYCNLTLGNLIHQQRSKQKSFPLFKIQEMMKTLLEGLDIMHSKLILHRDIKPDNILVDDSGECFN